MGYQSFQGLSASHGLTSAARLLQPPEVHTVKDITRCGPRALCTASLRISLTGPSVQIKCCGTGGRGLDQAAEDDRFASWPMAVEQRQRAAHIHIIMASGCAAKAMGWPCTGREGAAKGHPHARPAGKVRREGTTAGGTEAGRRCRPALIGILIVTGTVSIPWAHNCCGTGGRGLDQAGEERVCVMANGCAKATGCAHTHHHGLWVCSKGDGLAMHRSRRRCQRASPRPACRQSPT